MDRREIIRMAREAADPGSWKPGLGNESVVDFMKRFAELVAAKEREAIMDEWHMCVQSDLENGVKWMNERAAEVWAGKYPAMAGFAAAVEKRGATDGKPT